MTLHRPSGWSPDSSSQTCAPRVSSPPVPGVRRDPVLERSRRADAERPRLALSPGGVGVARVPLSIGGRLG